MSPPSVTNPVHLSSVLSTVHDIAQSLTLAANAVDALAKSEPVKLLVRARTLHAVKTGVPWVIVPVAAAGLAYWGVRAWQRRQAGKHVAPLGHNGKAQQAHPA